MADHAQNIFKFVCGGFFGGYWELEIFKSRDGYLATYANSIPSKSAERDFDVTAAQMEKLERQLDSSGVEDWYCNYFSPILDGTQWEICALGESFSGSNAFPKGFDALAAFLADEFDCKELMDGADDRLIIASMIAISRSDRFCGYSDDFGKCAKNGTFERWLTRLHTKL